MKRLLGWSFLLGAVGLPIALLGLVALALEERAVVGRTLTPTPEQVERAKRLLGAHDVRKAPSGVLRTLTVSGEDLELALNALLAQQGGAAKVVLAPGTLMLWLSFEVPGNPFGSFANVEAVAHQAPGLPQFELLRIGRVAVPAVLADWLLARALERLTATPTAKAAADVVEGVRMDAGFLQVEYRWREDLTDKLRGALVPAPEQERLRAYQVRLAALTADPGLPRQLSLVTLLRPLLQHAAERSQARAGDPAGENRAALVVLAFYVNGQGMRAIVPAARDWPRAVPRKVTLSGRGDFAQHFTVSAALAATAGTPLSDAIGLYKEVEDARSGSGFSFTDIAADRAGTLFGEHATRTAEAARALQRRLGDGVVEADFMPRTAELPEMLKEAEFKRRFGGVGEPPYRDVMREIERRLGTLALYR
ncbi:MAG: hypothetical protein IT531_02535 [Burkholderiales bacterium]|nr:hypothetical protein [Burkholderiales bacterium]